MNDNSPTGHTSPLEILAQWEGPVVHEQGVLLGEMDAEHLSTRIDAGELVAWLAATALSATSHDPAYPAIRAKVFTVLSAWQQRVGQDKMDEIKRQLLLHMEQFRKYGKITEEELRERIERLFAEVPAEPSSGKDSSAP
jgi:hypothetical protein